MSELRISLPEDVVETIVDAVVERVLARLDSVRPASEPASPYLTVPEAAELLRCKRQRIDDLLSSRRLTRIKEGARTLVLRTEIEAHLQHEGSRR
jgi:excisionase family DNA binding protein